LNREEAGENSIVEMFNCLYGMLRNLSCHCCRCLKLLSRSLRRMTLCEDCSYLKDFLGADFFAEAVKDPETALFKITTAYFAFFANSS